MEQDFLKRMEDVWGTTSWVQFGLLVGFIALILLGIKLIIFILDNLSHQSKLTAQIRKLLQFVLDHIEPFIVLVVIGYFININYSLHIPIVLLLVIGGYRQIRDYITGKALKYNGALVNGSFISIGDISGEVGDLRRLGVQIKTKDATHFYSYARLYDNGFTIHANDAFGGYYNLDVSIVGEEMDAHALRSIVINSPYSDEFNDVRIEEVSPNSNDVKMSVHLRRTAHLEDLKELLRARGYECS